MKFLFVGLGGIGQRHLRNLRQVCAKDDEIWAYRVRRKQFVLDNKLSIEENANLEEKYDLQVVCSLEDAMLLKPDVVFVCNPSSIHMEILLEAAKTGCHMFIEKPVSHNLQGMDKLCNIVKEKELVTFVGYQQRYHPCVQEAKRFLDEGVLGEILSVEAEIGECVKNWHKYEDYRTLYACRSDLGGGVVLTQIHELDYLYYFFGLPQSVYAVGGQLSNLEIDVEDVVDILMSYRTQDGRMIPVHIHEDYLQNPATRTCKIIGNKGKLEFDLLNAILVLYDESGKCIYKQEYVFERNEMFKKELEIFLECVQEHKNSPISLEEGIQSLKMAMAVKESIQSKNIVFMENIQ